MSEHHKQFGDHPQVDYDQLDARYGKPWMQRRLQRQWQLYAKRHHHPARWLFHVYLKLFRFGIRAGLWSTGQWRRARALAGSHELVAQKWTLPTLPDAFAGFRILQLSDFHFSYHPGLAELIVAALRGVKVDVCVMTGDYRGDTMGSFDPCLDELEKVVAAIDVPVYAVLGNHDAIEMVPRIEAMGVTVLINESLCIERDGQHLILAGIDDVHVYQTHDFAPFRDRVRAADCSILLSHSPESFEEAEAAGFDLVLSGHTHGGQLCLPGGTPVVTHLKRTPKTMASGRWAYQAMQGYTSRGAGTSSMNVRLNCPPEITVHVLEGLEGNER